MSFVYFTATLDAATWGAGFASGEGPGRICLVEPTAEFEDDPNITDKNFPGSFTSLRIGSRPEQLRGRHRRHPRPG